jgi:pilus assembly protein CpaC
VSSYFENSLFTFTYLLITIHANAMSDQLYIGETIYLNDPTVTDVVIGNDQIVKAKK